MNMALLDLLIISLKIRKGKSDGNHPKLKKPLERKALLDFQKEK